MCCNEDCCDCSLQKKIWTAFLKKKIFDAGTFLINAAHTPQAQPLHHRKAQSIVDSKMLDLNLLPAS
jgi:hypothetical protein